MSIIELKMSLCQKRLKSSQKSLERVVKLRKERGLTQEQLAHKANIERSYMGAIERGEKNPTLKKLYSISNALKVKPNKLLSPD